jgi:hypothetical protein
VKFSFAKPLDSQVNDISSASRPNEQLKLLAALVDKTIHQQFHLWPNNYIAYDVLYDSSRFSSHYNNQEKQQFIEYMNYKFNLLSITGTKDDKEQTFLDIYANPVRNKYDS